MQTQTHYMSFKSVSTNRFGKSICNDFTSRYVLNDNLFSLDGISKKEVMPLNMLIFPMEPRILSKLNGSRVVAHKLYGIINSWRETKILENTP